MRADAELEMFNYVEPALVGQYITVYDGAMRDGLFHGEGRAVYKEGHRYEVLMPSSSSSRRQRGA